MKVQRKGLIATLICSLVIVFTLGIVEQPTVVFAQQMTSSDANAQILSIQPMSSTLKVGTSKVSLTTGSKKTVSLTYKNKKLAASKATWKTSKSSVATVKDGVITAKGKGTATITAKYSGKEVDVKVTVTDPQLHADLGNVTMKKGTAKSVHLTYDEKIVAASKATWSTSKASVATVKSGVITAVGKGAATITAKYNGAQIQVKVTVTDSGLKANISKVTINKGGQIIVFLTYDGQSLTASKATWSTSKSAVATVKDGVITAKDKGTATITAKYSGVQIEIDVTVP